MGWMVQEVRRIRGGLIRACVNVYVARSFHLRRPPRHHLTTKRVRRFTLLSTESSNRRLDGLQQRPVGSAEHCTGLLTPDFSVPEHHLRRNTLCLKYLNLQDPLRSMMFQSCCFFGSCTVTKDTSIHTNVSKTWNVSY